MTTTPSPTPFPDLLALATKDISSSDYLKWQAASEDQQSAKAELIRRALAFFAAGGYDYFKHRAEEHARIPGVKDSFPISLLRILDGVDAGTGTGEKETKQS